MLSARRATCDFDARMRKTSSGTARQLRMKLVVLATTKKREKDAE
jgi:hypothetical protein